ncbi:hypothetical protein RHGRI_001178 [Rhododendron griersonianum]|uniref:Aminotransferase-like plant mobile domain-containing protein n=1 Tax=Rhododendron griersonianum TaxID=479676 RepID=A0AAV6LKG2_9ERIC|nr:hypothetical protein RHGRI_001178 [Rhododendron griersonianum]
MRIHRVESRIRKRKQPSPAVMDLIRRACLEGLCSVSFLSLDWALITALVERWRPETHTFHMRPSELTIMLQDVEILLGIPVDGRPVTGTTLFNPDDLCLRLLGEAPGERDKKGGKVKLKWLRDRFNGIIEDGAAAEVVARQARGYLLLLLGGTSFADFTGGCVHLSYLQLLENFDVAGEYSWDSGALSILYRNLCHGAKIKSKQMTGPFILVQVWAWERFPYLAPGRRGKWAPQPGAPLLGRIVRSNSFSTIQRSTVQHFLLCPSFADPQVPLTMYVVSGNYATALYIAAAKANALEKVESELLDVVEASNKSTTFSMFMKDLSVPADTRIKAITEICDEAKFSDLTRNFFGMAKLNIT